MVSNDVLDLREDPMKGVMVAGLSEIEVTTPDEILELLIFGNRNRTCEATGANETSSRSHAVLQVTCEYRDKHAGIQDQINVGKLSLIDLAGSERA
jgi:kinesin family protein 18/19